MNKKELSQDIQDEINMLDTILFNLNMVTSNMSELPIDSQLKMLAISQHLTSTIESLKKKNSYLESPTDSNEQNQPLSK